MEGCSGLAPLWHLFEVQMTGLKQNVEFITFKNGCQRTVLIFAAERRLRSGGAFSQPISQLRNEEWGLLITTQKVLFYTFNALCFKHFCVVDLHL